LSNPDLHNCNPDFFILIKSGLQFDGVRHW
jgi:hypothetical protein